MTGINGMKTWKKSGMEPGRRSTVITDVTPAYNSRSESSCNSVGSICKVSFKSRVMRTQREYVGKIRSQSERCVQSESILTDFAAEEGLKPCAANTAATTSWRN